ncbi:MAG TPA: AAA family ATPase, partial [Polyangiaceae bacterium]|nr:AAA family ATPase [Polyangiaceae bacterium]
MDEVRSNYVIETSARTLDSARLRRGHRRSDGLPVVIKVPRSEYPSAAELAEIHQEYALLRELADAPVAHALELVRIERTIGLVLEEGPSTSLAQRVKPGGLELPEFLLLARLATEALQAVHARGILHKDIKPEHFLYDASNARVVLIDFGIATTLKQEQQHPTSLAGLDGTLAYLSPEQTGRMNRAVDRRSDLYSLGVVLYQLLTGVLPFETLDPLELVHCHIARSPRPPAELRAMPRSVSEIVLRLLEKVAEKRYQTAGGLRADLTRCEAELSRSGEIEPFRLGRQDHSSELRIPQKLYGRTTDIAVLTAAFGRARAGGNEFVLVRGGAGVGKTALVQELWKELGFAGTFAAGKFDQFNRNLPYSGVARAAAELVRAELASPAERLAKWKSDVLAAVANNGRLLTDIVAELELVIGVQPEVVALGPVEAQYRFEGLFQRFMQASASAEQPLVVFLDDLQWA